MNYYISDLHFGHSKIIGLCDRPYSSVDEMNERILDVLTQTVSGGDRLYLLGDVGCADNDPTSFLKRIDCEKILIVGNHDKRWLHHRHFRQCFEEIYDNKIVRDGDGKIFLSHYPMAEWDGYYKGIYHFYGHIHNAQNGAATIMALYENAVNVSIDQIGRPRTASELIENRKKTFNPPATMDEILRKLRVGKYYEGE